MNIQNIHPVKSVLIIEENLGDVRIIQKILKQSDDCFYKTTNCGNLAEGIKALNREKFDAILLDLDLPDSSNINTLKTLVRNKKDLQFVIATNMALINSTTLAYPSTVFKYRPHKAKRPTDVFPNF